ncbi:MAG: YggT family protein [Steroidobacteraceae bacterium]
MNDALYFLIQTLLGLYQGVLLLRLLMQLTRANFRNPAARAVLQVTDPLVRPLRRLLPAAGKVDTATVVAIVAVGVVKLLLIQLLVFGTPLGADHMVRLLAVDLVRLVLRTYFFCILLYALLSFVAQGNYSPVQDVLASICEPIMKPIRRRLPPISGLDLTPLWVLIAIQALLLIVR